MSERLDALRLPLWGSRLIEASAGTGKTWTIAALYLRLVLGHGEDGSAFGRPLLPAEILVMTFTRAATRELSDRIRARLLQAARCFRGEVAPDPGDALLASLLDAYAAGEARTQAAWRLACAAEAMDDAAVHTIDAWCQRMLREHAFDSNNLFDEELLADERALLEEAVRDHWRQQVYPLDSEQLEAVLKIWPGMERLMEDVTPLLGKVEADPEGRDAPPALGALCGQLLRERAQGLAELKRGWTERVQELRSWFAAQLARKDCPFNRSKIQPRYYEPWLETLETWAATPQQDVLDLRTGRKRLTPQGMGEACKPGAGIELPDHFAALEDLQRALGQLPDLGKAVRQHAAACIARRLAELKAQAGTFGFADMLERLDVALRRTGGARLRERIVAQYPAVLIDEFQDTSPLQYRIFDSLYRAADNPRGAALFLIGDPKQSIYAFRGADIHSYLSARRATAGRHYMLGTNHRSTQALVQAVNRLFAQAEERHAEGAFLFRRGDDHPLPFEAVEARGRKERLVASGGEVPALTFCHDGSLCDSRTSMRRFAERCAEQIVTLLNDERAGFAHPEQGFTRLRPADIAVLVRTGVEAEAVRRELRRRNVASVYLSDKDSVFDSTEARDLLRWLRAVATPLDLRLARAAYATATVGLSLAELARLASDDEAWEVRLEELRQLQSVWQRQGVLTMLRQTLHRLQLPSRWLQQMDGERRLTNYLHLAELLQAASAQLDGEQALIRWFAEQIDDDRACGDERIVRLESDADLVKVVTVHKSKGLEYPLVFLPFASDFRPVDKRGRSFLEVTDDDGTRRLEFVLTPEAIERADRERLREDLRLLYVALTRARHALWVGVAALKKGQSSACVMHRCALGQLLGGGLEIAEGEIAERLGQACGDCEAIAVVEAQASTACTQLQRRADDQALQPAEVYDAPFERDWGVGSFSALVKHLASTSVDRLLTELAREPELLDGNEAHSEALPGKAAAPWHRFPKGAYPGNFLHDQLEWLAGEGFALETSERLRAQLLKRCEQQGWGHRKDDVLAWLREALRIELPPLGVPLSRLDAHLPEMEFWLPNEGLASARVDALCRRHLLGGRSRPALPERQLRGMLMGFADLVFEHGGRYWVLDYKSNALGDRDSDYHAGALEAAMAAHRYDVQGAIYLLALHRLLRARLGAAYDPQQHLGGAIYFFLRGLQGPERGCFVIAPDTALLDALDAALGTRQEAAQ